MLDGSAFGDTRYTIGNVMAVVAGDSVPEARIRVEQGRIVEVARAPVSASGADVIDGTGLIAMPGLIDTHNDGLENEVRPRPTVTMPIELAVAAYEQRLRAAGITTVYHGVYFSDEPMKHRTVAMATELCQALRDGAAGPSRCDQRVLYRVETRSAAGWATASDELDAWPPGTHPSLVSLEDHAPGAGQFKDVAHYRRLRAREIADPAELDRYVRQRLDEAERTDAVRSSTETAAASRAHAANVRLLAHDLVDAADVDHALALGAAVAEFPLTLEAATRAHTARMHVVLGAPNIVTGRSHTGRISAAELVARGLCTSLASDYYPSSLLAAVFELVSQQILPLPAAVALATSGPAKVAGLTDRGTLTPGSRADILLVDPSRRWPAVQAVLTADPDWTG
jgi:alpha-D-ribose 1-methylphosphonate 5-triphosphate diphosphatase